MGDKTNISWCDSTVNPTSGCDGCELFNPLRPASATCYAKGIHENRLARSYPDKYAAAFENVRLVPGRMAKAAAMSDMRGKPRRGKPWLNGKPRFIFVGDMADIFSKAVPFEYLRDEVFAPMVSENGQRHFWIVLTKRPQRMAEFSKTIEWPDNCIAMTSITSQKSADARLLHLFRVDAKLLGISAEPMHEAVDIEKHIPIYSGDEGTNSYDTSRLRWLIVGGESGPRRKDCGVEAIVGMAGLGAFAGIPTFVKQDSAPRDGDRGRLPQKTWDMKQFPV